MDGSIGVIRPLDWLHDLKCFFGTRTYSFLPISRPFTYFCPREKQALYFIRCQRAPNSPTCSMSIQQTLRLVDLPEDLLKRAIFHCPALTIMILPSTCQALRQCMTQDLFESVIKRIWPRRYRSIHAPDNWHAEFKVGLRQFEWQERGRAIRELLTTNADRMCHYLFHASSAVLVYIAFDLEIYFRVHIPELHIFIEMRHCTSYRTDLIISLSHLYRVNCYTERLRPVEFYQHQEKHLFNACANCDDFYWSVYHVMLRTTFDFHGSELQLRTLRYFQKLSNIFHPIWLNKFATNVVVYNHHLTAHPQEDDEPTVDFEKVKCAIEILRLGGAVCPKENIGASWADIMNCVRSWNGDPFYGTAATSILKTKMQQATSRDANLFSYKTLRSI